MQTGTYKNCQKGSTESTAFSNFGFAITRALKQTSGKWTRQKNCKRICFSIFWGWVFLLVHHAGHQWGAAAQHLKSTGFYFCMLWYNSKAKEVTKFVAENPIWNTESTHPSWSCLLQHMRSLMHTAFTLCAPMLTYHHHPSQINTLSNFLVKVKQPSLSSCAKRL